MALRQYFIVCMMVISVPDGIIGESNRCTINNYSLLCDKRELVYVPHVEENILLLNFANNKLQALLNNTFKDYSQLETLYLQGNDIDKVEYGTFSILYQLEQVDLSENFITYIHPDMFIHNNKLKTVNLQGNPLLKVDFSAPFLNAPSLVNLDLSFCGISSLSEKSFSMLNSLFKLNLSSNNLQVLSVKVLNYLPNIKVVNLENNRWTCDCSLSTLLEWIRDIRPYDETYHPRVYCYVNVLEQIRDRQTIFPGEHKYCDSNGSSTGAPEVSAPTFVEEALISSLSLTRNTETLLSSSVEGENSESVYDMQSVQELRDASFAGHTSDIVTGSIIILMLIITVLLAFTLIRYLKHLYNQPYTISNNFVPQFYDGRQNLISTSGLDHTYEYIKIPLQSQVPVL